MLIHNYVTFSLPLSIGCRYTCNVSQITVVVDMHINVKTTSLSAYGDALYKSTFYLLTYYALRHHYVDQTVYTLCLNKVYPLMFDNNFGKCGPIFKILSLVDS